MHVPDVPNAPISSHVIQFHVFKSDRAMCTVYVIHLSLFIKQNTGIITVVQDKKKTYTEISSKVAIIAILHREIFPVQMEVIKKNTRSLIHFVWTSGKHVHF